MAITFVGGSDISTGTSFTITPPLVVGWAPEDLLIVALGQNQADRGFTPPVNWVQQFFWPGGSISSGVYTKIAEAGETDPEFTSDSDNPMTAIMTAWRGVDLASPIEDAQDATGWGTTHTCPSVTSGGAGRAAVAILQRQGNLIVTPPSGYTYAIEHNHPWGNSQVWSRSDYRLDIPSGPSGTAVYEIAGGGAWGHSMQMALLPASAGPSVSIPALERANQ